MNGKAVASVGIVLMLAVGAGIFFFYPSGSSSTKTTTTTTSSTYYSSVTLYSLGGEAYPVNMTSANMTLSLVEFHSLSSPSSSVPGWHTVSRSALTFSLKNGSLKDLGTFDIPTGQYDEVRLTYLAVSATVNGKPSTPTVNPPNATISLAQPVFILVETPLTLTMTFTGTLSATAYSPTVALRPHQAFITFTTTGATTTTFTVPNCQWWQIFGC